MTTKIKILLILLLISFQTFSQISAARKLLLSQGSGSPSTELEFFGFVSDSEGWTYVASADPDETGGWNASQNMYGNISGRNKLTDGSYMYWQGTWEDMGVPASSTVTAVRFSYDFGCNTANTSDGWTRGPASILNSDGTVLIGNTSALLSSSGTLASNTVTGSDVSVGASYQASNTTIRLYIYLEMDNGNNASAETNLYFDSVSVVITYN